MPEGLPVALVLLTLDYDHLKQATGGLMSGFVLMMFLGFDSPQGVTRKLCASVVHPKTHLRRRGHGTAIIVAICPLCPSADRVMNSIVEPR
jgi:hypothetical protein